MARLGRAQPALARGRFIRPKGGPARCPPTLVSYGATAWNTATTPKTLGVTWQTGDVVVMSAMCADDAIAEFDSYPTDTGSLQPDWQPEVDIRTGSRALLKVWTVLAASGGSETFSFAILTNPNSAPWGFNVFVFRDTDGRGVSESATGTGQPSNLITTTAPDSAVISFVADWAAVDGASRTWRTISGVTPTLGNGLEKDYFHSANYTIYTALYDDVGSIGSYTTGLTAPTGQTFSIASIEVLGAICVEPPPLGLNESWGFVLIG